MDATSDRRQHEHALKRYEVFLRDVIEPAVYDRAEPLEAAVFQCADPVPFRDAARAQYRPVNVGWEWGPSWSTAWFRVTGRVPATMKDRSVCLRFSTDTEALLWKPTPRTSSGGTPIHGLDVNRDAVRLFETARGGERVDLYVEAACNHLFGDRGLRWDPAEVHRRWNSPTPGRLDRCELAALDETVWRLRWVYSFALQLARELAPDSARAQHLIAALRRATNTIPDDRVNTAAAAALRELEQAVRTGAGGSATVCHAVGHAHIDTAWLWPLRETRRKCMRTFATVLRNMERYPDFRFLCSQAQQYAWLEETSPELFSQVRRRVAEGRWEPGGGMWIEADCTSPSGESLVRQILHGDRYWRGAFGDKRGAQRFLYLPDTFGFPAQLPQIMARAGLDTFITNKLHWNDTNVFPHTTFVWRGLDGSEVLAHQTPGMDYNATNTPRELVRGERTHRNKDLLSQTAPHKGGARWLQPFGYGDGGGGPTDWSILNADLARECEGIARVRPSTVTEFCDALHQDVAHVRVHDPAAVRTHEGEIYLELHRGTATTHARVKAANTACEELLRQAEILTFAGPARLDRARETEARAKLDRAWKLLLLNQFHDILPGSSIAWVYADAERDYAEIRRIAEPLILDGIARWAAAAGGAGIEAMKSPTAVFNPASRGIHDATMMIRRRRDVTADGLAVVIADEQRRPGKAEQHSFAVRAGRNGRLLEAPGQGLRVELDRAGRIARLSTSRGVEYAGPGSELNQLVLYEDRPRMWDAWDIDAEHAQKAEPITGDADSIEVVEAGPESAAIRVFRPIGRRSRASIVYRVTGHRPWVEVEMEIDWRERHRLLRALFPCGAARSACTAATMGTQFGHIERPASSVHEHAARFEAPAHRFISSAAVFPGTGAGERLAVLIDRPRGASFSHGTLGLSLLRASTYPDPEADQGVHRLRYAIYAGARALSPIVMAAEEFGRPVRAVPLKAAARRGRSRKTAPRSWSPLSISSYPHHVEVECIKPGDRTGELVLRLCERAGLGGDVEIAWNLPLRSVRPVDLLERPAPLEGFTHRRATGRTAFRIRPFQIVTLSAIRAD